MNMTPIYITMTLTVFLSVPVWSSPVSTELSHLPAEERVLHGLSELEWDVLSGGEPEKKLDSIITPTSNEQNNPAFQVTISQGSIEPQIGRISLELGFAGGQWALTEFNVQNELQFGSNHPNGVLQAILDYTEMDGVIRVFKNRMVSFDPK